MTVAAVIVAGGVGLRAGGERPKQYHRIGGKPVIWWTMRAFATHPAVSLVQPVIGEGHEEWFKDAAEGISTLPPITGGSTRQDSCRIGIEALVAHSPSKVLIHDAARPFIDPELISEVVAALDTTPCVIPALPIADTLKYAPGGIITRTVDRAAMWAAQTPQGFAFNAILDAHRRVARDGVALLTDDASIAEHVGLQVAVIQGNTGNVKLTTAADLSAAEAAMSAKAYADLPDVRTGQGFDIHAFAPGKAVVLCGVSIPHTKKLKGHSDADAAMHALTDAILGAIGEGDIGSHFPPSDPQWKNAPSSIFLEKAVSLLKSRGGIVAHADITILAEVPKISPHVLAMKGYLAPLLGIGIDRIAIKATTMEKIGGIGRGEGIAAMAVATVRLP
ncbi:MAG: bifunctional 2-C-methyl-D-erythritol 4-phosphate cytidylyltransferase/2-C-methyl-D-erythritol 2,4-cyclodiphosphate synthase [Aestuariivirga sp.]